MPLYRYLYADGTLDRLLANHVDWRDVEHVLKVAHPVVRRHIGPGGLVVIGPARDGVLLWVDCIEVLGEDDTFEIYDAHYLQGGAS